MPIAEAAEFFEPISAIHRFLKTLVDVGLGYVRLGQSATTLSGGEAQRVKLATELQRRSNGRSVYVLDEPTTGLHFEDVRKLLLGAQRAGRQGQHRHRHRAQPRRDQVRRLDRRHGPGGRRRRRHGHRRGHARAGRRDAGQPHRPLPRRGPAAAGAGRVSAAMEVARDGVPGRWRRPSAWRPKAGEIPTSPGVYRFRDPRGRVLYVGKAKNLRARLSNYFQPLRALHERTRRMVLTRRERRVDGRRHRVRGAAARVHLDQGVRSAVQRAVPRRQVVPVPRDHARRRGSARDRHAQPQAQGREVLRPVHEGVGDPRDARPDAQGRSRCAAAPTRRTGARSRPAAPACSATSASARRPASAASPKEAHRDLAEDFATFMGGDDQRFRGDLDEADAGGVRRAELRGGRAAAGRASAR